MKLEVGQFVRTNLGEIGKLKEVNPYFIKIEIKKNVCFTFEEEDVVKASFNIIDILEVGDYVNGLPITKISEYLSTHEKYIELYGTCSDWENEDINSVVTHERMEQIEYNVGE